MLNIKIGMSGARVVLIGTLNGKSLELNMDSKTAIQYAQEIRDNPQVLDALMDTDMVNRIASAITLRAAIAAAREER